MVHDIGPESLLKCNCVHCELCTKLKVQYVESTGEVVWCNLLEQAKHAFFINGLWGAVLLNMDFALLWENELVKQKICGDVT